MTPDEIVKKARKENERKERRQRFLDKFKETLRELEQIPNGGELPYNRKDDPPQTRDFGEMYHDAMTNDPI